MTDGSICLDSKISIHALLAESDRHWQVGQKRFLQFLSTLSLRRATSPPSITPTARRNFYPRSPCGERPDTARCPRRNPRISIHALLAESDLAPGSCVSLLEISIHALLAESDDSGYDGLSKVTVFLSTLSLRRATGLSYFYIIKITGISIHALLAESDNSSVNTADQEARFLSTLSLRRATISASREASEPIISIHALLAESDVRPTGNQPSTPGISIHALLAESDFTGTLDPKKYDHFYPRSPCGERHSQTRTTDQTTKFLSTLSLRRATTAFCMDCQKSTYFYPRSPCGERHPYRQNKLRCTLYFYPRSPCGERPAPQGSGRSRGVISIHALLAESDARFLNWPAWPQRFLSTLSLRRATFPGIVQFGFHPHFYPRSPCGERQLAAHANAGRVNFYPRSPCGERRHPKYPKGYH